jgi:NAD(P)H-dependent FMN reductase
MKSELQLLREFYDAQIDFDTEDEGSDRRTWQEASDRLEEATKAVAEFYKDASLKLKDKE